MPDATGLIFQENVGSNAEIWVLPLEGDGEPHPLLQSESGFAQPSLSPDGRWIAYHSDVSGGTQKSFVQPFPGLGGRKQISIDGGRSPLWSPAGGEIFYTDDNSRSMMVVAIRTEPELEVGPPQRLFEWPEYELGRQWDVTPDGQRFVVARRTDTTGGAKSTSSSTGSRSSSAWPRRTELALFEPSETLFNRMHNQRPETFTRLVGHVNEPNAHPATNTCLGDTPFRTPNHFRV